MTFQGELLKKWRLERKLSQVAAGETVNVSQGFWREMEVGIKQQSIDTLILISQVTGLSADELLGNSAVGIHRRAVGMGAEGLNKPSPQEIAAEIAEFRDAINDLFPALADRDAYADILLDLKDNGRIDAPEMRAKIKRGIRALEASLVA